MNNILIQNNLGFYILPTIIFLIILYALTKKVPIFEAFLGGATSGIESTFKIAPTLIGLVTAVTMLKNSGALDIFTNFFSPLAQLFNFPKEIIPLALLKPISGSGSIALLNNIFENYSPDSLIGKLASIISSSTETTFYVIAIYFGSVKLKNYRHTVLCALLVDICAFITTLILTVYV